MEKQVNKPVESKYSGLKYYVSAGIAIAAATAIGLFAGAKNSEGVNHVADHVSNYYVKMAECLDRNSPEFVKSFVRYSSKLRSGGKSPQELNQESKTFKQALEKRLENYHSPGGK